MKMVIGIYICFEVKITKKLGASWFIRIIFSSPSPILAPIKSCGVIPIIDPKKKFLIFILNNVGKIFEIAKGMPPINL